jgi:hypothetical protein
MVRFLALLVALVIPFQAVVAMAASYCESEPPSINHPGHHAHVISDDALSQSDLHLSKSVDSAQKALTESGDGHPFGSLHCGVCHFGCGAAMVLTASELRLSLTTFSPPSQVSFLLPSPIPNRPERPKWSDLA